MEIKVILLFIFAQKEVWLPGFPNKKATKILKASYLVVRTPSYSYSLQDLDENLTNEDVKRDISSARRLSPCSMGPAHDF